MKKFLAMVLTVVMAVSLLGGCAGAHVHVCPTQPIATAAPTQSTESTVPQATTAGSSDDAVKTGLAVVTGIADSTDAAADKNGSAVYDVTLVAVTVDDNGVIDSCAIDGIKSTVEFDTKGVITTDLTAAPQTKNELGEAYGMKAYAGSAYEWNEQAQALADYAVGKTVEELKTGAVNESGKAADADLASVATIYIGGYVDAIAMAAETATHLGAHRGDKLVLSTLNGLDSSVNAEAEKDGTAQLDVNVTALTMNGDTITSCILDGLQAKVSFDATGKITTDLTAAPQTKNQLGEAYGMKAYAGSTYEWNEQAASFAAYVTGKTAEEVSGIAVDESTKVTEADLAASVTIAVGGFQALIAKAAG